MNICVGGVPAPLTFSRGLTSVSKRQLHSMEQHDSEVVIYGQVTCVGCALQLSNLTVWQKKKNHLNFFLLSRVTPEHGIHTVTLKVKTFKFI